MFSLLFEAGDRRTIALSAIAGVLLVLSATWTVRKWSRYAPSQESVSSASAGINGNDIGQRVAAEQPESPLGDERKRHSASHDERRHHHHHHHHKHAKTLSSSRYVEGEHRETARLLHSRAQIQPNYSGISHHENDEHASRIPPFQETQGEPNFVSSAWHSEQAGRKVHDQSSRPDSQTGILPDRSKDTFRHPGDLERERAADELNVLLQRLAQDHLERNPDDLLYWEILEDEHLPSERYGDRRAVEPPGKRYRDLALQEARYRKDAFENSKRAFKLGRKAEAKQLSDQGKRHDENVRRYNAHAAAEIFQSYNPRYNAGKLSRCDLHGLHVDEALECVRQHLVTCRRAGEPKTMLIVGKGSHSHDGAARVKPAILAMLAGTGGIIAAEHEKNEGCINVEFVGGHH